MTSTAGHNFRVRDRVTVGGRAGQVIALADDPHEPILLIRWDGGRICDWKKSDEAVFVAEPDEPDSHEEKVV